MQLEVPRLDTTERQRLLKKSDDDEGSSTLLREQVLRCRQLQLQRQGDLNARLSQAELKEHCALSAADTTLLNDALSRLKLSTRACFRILRIARTLADLAGDSAIGRTQLLEALNYRRFELG